MAVAGVRKCSKIRHIVTLRQMLRRWRHKAAMAGARQSGGKIPSDVPAGHVAVAVGSCRTRFVVRATYLNHPVFKNLLVQTEELYGFTNNGPLAIPCDESVFEEILRLVSRPDSANSCRFANLEEDLRSGSWAESRPMLRRFSENPIW